LAENLISLVVQGLGGGSDVLATDRAEHIVEEPQEGLEDGEGPRAGVSVAVEVAGLPLF
jgi:hypothetical protein